MNQQHTSKEHKRPGRPEAPKGHRKQAWSMAEMRLIKNNGKTDAQLAKERKEAAKAAADNQATDKRQRAASREDAEYFNPQPKPGSFNFITEKALEILRRDDPSEAYAAHEKEMKM